MKENFQKMIVSKIKKKMNYIPLLKKVKLIKRKELV